MTSEDKWIQQLHSPNKDKRYEACEQLRIMDSLSTEARGALEQATHDPVQWVAEVARHALAVHSSSDTEIPATTPATKPYSVWYWLGGALLFILLGASACVVIVYVSFAILCRNGC